jgi:flavin-dependent dehydrogenase
MKYKVAVVGGGPAGACAAEIFAQEKNIETVMFERKLDNAKPCGGAIPLCMVGEFDLPESVVDRKVSGRVGVSTVKGRAHDVLQPRCFFIELGSSHELGFSVWQRSQHRIHFEA